MVQQQVDLSNRRGLIVGNYCHDVLIKDGNIIGENLGGASSFISNVLDNLSITHCNYISKVGFDFSYSVSHAPIVSPSSPTTLFHAHFVSNPNLNRSSDRVLKRIHGCDPISPSDLPNSRFDFGLAVGVGGEIVPETLERMIDICGVVFVDIQALIRVFDPIDGTVKLVGLRESGFFHLLPRIGFLKASAEEAPYVNVEEARKWCCVVVTDGKDGCRVYWKDGELQISPFLAVQIDPTGAGDSFLGGFVGGLVCSLNVSDAALVGNFFGSLTVGQIGVPKFDSRLLQAHLFHRLVKAKMFQKARLSSLRIDAQPGSSLSSVGQGFLVKAKRFHRLVKAKRFKKARLSSVRTLDRCNQRVKEEIHRRTMESTASREIRDVGLELRKSAGHQEFHSSLVGAKLVTTNKPQ
ncbi:hypothetical protein GIB67_036776 [Kingdonia uniflora]|uniref:Carbohydrate kinase PfkB domain-containing protein n=1 Tax=Kingdonia uniflora TaxID=39325 RepID=A0A7J7LWS9_9MAGN|nr:hypothetical protein GIB67_036776 [Kingdonia uniflora]